MDIVESLTLRDDPLLMLALVQTRFATGTHELYQLPLGLRPLSEIDAPDSIVRGEEWTVYDALGDPDQARELLRRMDSGEETETADGRFSFHKTSLLRVSADDADVRPIGVEQSNSSLVFDEEMVLKVFRKLEPGVNPELEMLRFLTAHEFPNIAPLHGWYEYEGLALSTTLGVAQTFFPDARGGWELALEEIGSEPDGFLERLGSLGARHRAAAQRACLGRGRPGVLAGGAQPGGAVAADGDRRRGHRADLPAAARRRAPGADRRTRAGRPRAAGGPCPDRDHRPRDPDPRRLSPRPDPVHAARLGDHRLRGRARPRPARAPPEALAAARRRGHAAFVCVRRFCGRNAQ